MSLEVAGAQVASKRLYAVYVPRKTFGGAPSIQLTDMGERRLRALCQNPHNRPTFVAEELGITTQMLGRIADKLGVKVFAAGKQAFDWTDARVDRLKILWGAGRSAKEIASNLGDGVTRNAVIGKVNRLGLRRSGALADSARKGSRRPRVYVSAPARERAPAKPVVSQSELERRKAETAALPAMVAGSEVVGVHACRWPIGDPQDQAFGFCGRLKPEQGPYCERHRELAYQPAQTKPDLARALRKYL